MSALFRGLGPSSFDRLYRRHAAGVYRYVYAVLGNHADAEDVTQQTFLNAYRAIGRGTTPRKAENWLLTIAHNEVRRHFRRTHGRPFEVELDDRLADPVPDDADPSLGDLLRALQHLPPTQRAALVMREFEGRSYAEIAEILEVTPHALEGLIFRARRNLAERLEGSLTCTEAEDALLRRLDTRLARRESRRLKEHLRECTACVRFATVQKRQRSLLKGLSVLPIPASLYLFRGEQAALAAGAGTAAAAGGSAAVGGGGVAAAGGAIGLVVKTAAVVTASAAVVGGVGYGVSAGSATAVKADRKESHAAAVEQTRDGQRADQVHAALARGERPGPAAPANARALRRKVAKRKHGPTSTPAAKLIRAKKQPPGLARGHAAAREAAKERPSGPKSSTASRPAVPRARKPKPAQRQRPDAKPARPEPTLPKQSAKEGRSRPPETLTPPTDHAKGPPSE